MAFGAIAGVIGTVAKGVQKLAGGGDEQKGPDSKQIFAMGYNKGQEDAQQNSLGGMNGFA